MKIISAIFILLFTLQIFSQQVNVSGTVTDHHFTSNLPAVSVVVKDFLTSEVLGNDTTDSNGNYSITFIIDGVNDPSLPDDFYLSHAFPNPHNPATNLLFSVSLSGSYTVSIYNIIGERIYLQELNLEPGSYKLNISGLGSAGVYLFNISGKDFAQTEKLVLLDGGDRNVKVILSSGAKYLSKKSDINLLIEFRKQGYYEKDTTVNVNTSLVVDAALLQILVQGIGDYSGHVSLNTGGNGVNLNLLLTNTDNDTTLAQTVTDNFGEWAATFPYEYRTNGTDTLFNIEGVKILLSGQNIIPESIILTPFKIQHRWDVTATVITQFIDASYTIHAINEQTGEDIPNMTDVVKDQNNDSLFTITTNAQGEATATFQVGYTVVGNDTTYAITEYRSKLFKEGYVITNFTDPFHPEVILEKEVENEGQVNAWDITPIDIDGNPVTNMTYRYITNDGPKDFSVNGGSGKIEASWTDFHDVKQTVAELTHLNTANFDDVFVGVKSSPNLVNSDYLYLNSAQTIGGPANVTLVDIVLQNSNPSQEAYFIPQDWSTSTHGNFTWDGSQTGNEMKLILLAFGHPGTNKPIGDFNDNYNAVAEMDHFLFKWEHHSGNPISPSDLQQMFDVANNIAENDTMSHGKILGVTHIYSIDALSDPIYQTALARGQNNYRFGVTMKRNDPTPGHFTVFDPQDINRIDFFQGESAENVGQGTVLEETWEAITSGDDLLIPAGSSISYISNISNPGLLNLSGKRLYIIGKLFPKNTIF